MEDRTRLLALFPVVFPDAGSEPAPAKEKAAKKSARKPVRKDGRAGTRAETAVSRKAAPPPVPEDPRKQRLFELRQRGYGRLYQDGKIVEFAAPESLLELDFDRPVFVLLDRIAVSPWGISKSILFRL